MYLSSVYKPLMNRSMARKSWVVKKTTFTSVLKNVKSVKLNSRYVGPVISQRNYTSESSGESDLIATKWILKDGSTLITHEKEGMNLLDVAHKNDIDLEGACEASLACSTCHVIIDDEDVFELTGEPTDEENDMLDLAFGLTETSRLGCQVILSKELDGMVVRLPAATRNMMVDGHIPPKH